MFLEGNMVDIRLSLVLTDLTRLLTSVFGFGSVIVLMFQLGHRLFHLSLVVQSATRLNPIVDIVDKAIGAIPNRVKYSRSA